MPSSTLLQRLLSVRQQSEALIAPLEPEDLCLQGMADASPPKWHLAHTTWFFETFVLQPFLPAHRNADQRWGYLFNSYYEAVGPRQPRPQRGLLSRPPMAEVSTWMAPSTPATSSVLKPISRTFFAYPETRLAHRAESGLPRLALLTFT